jgi:hypothetical protein
MKFSCERCGKRYSTANEPGSGRVYRIPCRCGNTIILCADVAPDAATPPPLPGASRSFGEGSREATRAAPLGYRAFVRAPTVARRLAAAREAVAGALGAAGHAVAAAALGARWRVRWALARLRDEAALRRGEVLLSCGRLPARWPALLGGAGAIAVLAVCVRAWLSVALVPPASAMTVALAPQLDAVAAAPAAVSPAPPAAAAAELGLRLVAGPGPDAGAPVRPAPDAPEAPAAAATSAVSPLAAAEAAVAAAEAAVAAALAAQAAAAPDPATQEPRAGEPSGGAAGMPAEAGAPSEAEVRPEPAVEASPEADPTVVADAEAKRADAGTLASAIGRPGEVR